MSPSKAKLGLTRFDGAVFLTAAALIALLLLVIASGDNVGVSIIQFRPEGTANSASIISIEFSETMNHESVAAHFSINPPVTGAISWAGSTLIFNPAEPLPPDQTITVLLGGGAAAQSGRLLLRDLHFSFIVEAPRIAYLAPADAAPANLWIANPADPASARQITFSAAGLYDFSVSPSGTLIAFSENADETSAQDIHLLNLETGALEQITNCANAVCANPVWRPDGQMIVYERAELAGGTTAHAARLWLLDLTRRPVETQLLFSDLGQLGRSPQWSADGRRLILYDPALSAILLYDFTTDAPEIVATHADGSGALSPDGTILIYPELVVGDGISTHSSLQWVNLAENQVIPITDPPQAIDDARAAWRPDGQQIAISRRDESVMRGYQIYLLDPETFAVRRITDDPRYSNMYFQWDSSGQSLVIHRFPQLDENMQLSLNGLPEIWTLNTQTGELIQVAENAWMPRWLP